MKPFNFKIKTDVIFGPGRTAELAEILKKERFNAIAVIIDKGVKDNPDLKSAFDHVKEQGMNLDVFINEVAEPDYDFLDEFKKNFLGKDYDCIIGIGGGSTIDLAKGIATLIKNDGPAISYRGFPDLRNMPLPVIAIPTTAGTGSEVTYNAVFTDNREKRKLGINSRFNYPLYAIIDPKLTVSCPESATVSAGMDALVHTLESFVAKNSNTYSRMFSREAFRLLFNSLMKVLDRPGDLEIRGDIHLGSHFAGAALMNSGAGPAGAMSYPLGAVYKVPHGIAGAVFLASIVEFNAERGYKEYHELYDLIEGADKSLSIQEKNLAFAKEMRRLSSKLKVPTKLTVFGIKKSDIDFLIAQIFGGLKGAIEQNPIQITEKDMRKILETMF
ncbi:MAG: iron-containing alcohol dehydrogenase [Candidatus Woesearchaeota archaeon]|nr:iron-containing alcohol dehydrogenase [Candidatus Woesearchaeota archaeon]